MQVASQRWRCEGEKVEKGIDGDVRGVVVNKLACPSQRHPRIFQALRPTSLPHFNHVALPPLHQKLIRSPDARRQDRSNDDEGDSRQRPYRHLKQITIHLVYHISAHILNKQLDSLALSRLRPLFLGLRQVRQLGNMSSSARPAWRKTVEQQLEENSKFTSESSYSLLPLRCTKRSIRLIPAYALATLSPSGEPKVRHVIHRGSESSLLSPVMIVESQSRHRASS